MPSFAPGNSSCTAWASTWAAEWRMTLRPSSVSAATVVTSTSVSGAQLKSRSLPSTSRTTTTASGAPRLGRPASRTAAAAVVPAATRIRAAGAALETALIGHSLRFRGCLRTRPCYRCGGSVPDPDRAVPPPIIDPDELPGPVQRAEQPQGYGDDHRGEQAAEDLDEPSLAVKPVHDLVVAVPGV